MSNLIKNPKFGEVYLIRFHPAYGQKFKKYRPGVILSTKISELDPRFTLIAPVTSKTENLKKEELLLPSLPFLKKESALLIWYVRTVDITRLETKLGELPKDAKIKLKKKLKALFTK